MDIARTGIILCTVHYQECVRFYRDLFALPVMHEHSQGDFQLTCLAFGGSYLMIETGGVSASAQKGLGENPTKIRVNVPDLEAALNTVRAFGIDGHIENFDWGCAINIFDPDGNPVGIRDERSFQ